MVREDKHDIWENGGAKIQMRHMRKGMRTIRSIVKRIIEQEEFLVGWQFQRTSITRSRGTVLHFHARSRKGIRVVLTGVDFPGAIAEGDTPDEAITEGHEALSR